MKKVKIAVNGYGVIGKKVAEAVDLQDDMEIIGIGDVAADWRIQSTESKGYSIYANTEEGRKLMTRKYIKIAGDLDDLLDSADAVVDCAPKKFGAQNAEKYKLASVKYIVQGGEKHQTYWSLFQCRIQLWLNGGKRCNQGCLLQHHLHCANPECIETGRIA